MDVSDLRKAARYHFSGAVQFHSAGTLKGLKLAGIFAILRVFFYQGNHGVDERHILVLQLLHITDDLGLGVVRIEDGMRHEGGRPLERGIQQATLQVGGGREQLCYLSKQY